MKRHPLRGHVYSLRQLLALDLDDSPHLNFFHERRCVIQNSHLSDEDLLSVPGLADTEWNYVRTTPEWIPVFKAVNDAAVIACVDIEPTFDPWTEFSESFWVTPKGFPRQQYFVPFVKEQTYQLFEILKSAESLEVVKDDNGLKPLGDDVSEASALSKYKFKFKELVCVEGIVKAVFEVQQ